MRKPELSSPKPEKLVAAIWLSCVPVRPTAVVPNLALVPLTKLLSVSVPVQVIELLSPKMAVPVEPPKSMIELAPMLNVPRTLLEAKLPRLSVPPPRVVLSPAAIWLAEPNVRVPALIAMEPAPIAAPPLLFSVSVPALTVVAPL